MKKLKFIAFLFAIIVFISCQNGFNVKISEDNEVSPSSIAESYVSKVTSIDKIFSRSANSQDYSDIFYSMEIEDEEGNKINFADFSDEEKKIFIEDWKSEYIEELTQKFIADPDLAEMVNLENEAFYATLESSSGSRAIKSYDTEKFLEIYEKQLSKIAKQNSNARAVATSNEITSDCLVSSSVENFKNNYQKGNFLVCKDSSSSSSSSYIGHASMMYYETFQDEWKTNGLANATITSSPQSKSAQWTGKTDGVQYEPIGYWAGNSSGSANKVSIFKVQGIKKTWRLFRKTVTKYNAPSDQERAKAVSNADSNLGKAYNRNFFAKWKTDKFYCSQLVWRAWYDIDSKYDLSWGNLALLVSPADLANSQKSILLVSYQNK